MSFDLMLIDSDIKIKADGTVRTVEGSDKLKQDIIKILLTPIGSLKFHQWYGSGLSDKIIGENLPDNMTFQEISSSISQSLERLKTLQRSQITYQKVKLSEIINSIEEVLVQRSAEDMRQIFVIVSILTKDFTKIEETFSIQ